jgi:hypothetical protein
MFSISDTRIIPPVICRVRTKLVKHNTIEKEFPLPPPHKWYIISSKKVHKELFQIFSEETDADSTETWN